MVPNGEDEWLWNEEKSYLYIVKSTYGLLQNGIRRNE